MHLCCKVFLNYTHANIQFTCLRASPSLTFSVECRLQLLKRSPPVSKTVDHILLATATRILYLEVEQISEIFVEVENASII